MSKKILFNFYTELATSCQMDSQGKRKEASEMAKMQMEVILKS